MTIHTRIKEVRHNYFWNVIAILSLTWLYLCSHTVFLFEWTLSCGPIYFHPKAKAIISASMRIQLSHSSESPVYNAKANFSKSRLQMCGDLPHTRPLPPSIAMQSHTRHCPTSVLRHLEDSSKINIYLLAAKNPRTLPTTSSSPLQTSAHPINFACKAPLANPLHNSSREIVSLKTEPFL